MLKYKKRKNIKKTPITNKEIFRIFCTEHTKYIKNIELPEIKKQTNYEAVLIEFRILHNLEFILRNAIIKLGSEWCHTIICGNLNYDYMYNLCGSISPNINVIKLDHDNLNQSTYSILLASIEFWNNFKGNKILIYQEDSIIFKSNIMDFIEWDYIGAPWPKTQNDTLICVGNGGISLRTKSVMIDVIKTQDIKNIKINTTTQESIKKSNMTVCPEDVYFSKTIQEYNLGKVADWDTASYFSTEIILNNDSFAGHNFWISDPKWITRLYNFLQYNIPEKVKESFNEILYK